DLDCTIFAKLEMLNPGGSVKDRIAFPILDAYEASGELKPGGTVVEATSGNTGVGLAIACAIRGYASVFVLPDKMSQEKISMLRAFGARVVVTPTAVLPEDPRSYYSVAQRIVSETPNAVLANQYHNPANPQSHYETTGPEIWNQTAGKVTDIVCGMGTGGTITGIARFIRDQGHPVKIIGVDPQGSILFEAWKRGGDISGLVAASYLVEGIGEDFIPTTLDLSLLDEVVQVSDAESFAWTRRLVREEGIFCGGSCGAELAGAVKYAQQLGPDRNVVVILPDSGSRYLSKIFDNEWMREHGFSIPGAESATVADVAETNQSMDLVTARPDDPLKLVIDRMRASAVSQLPVVDEHGRLLGVVSEVDLLKHLIETEADPLAAMTIAAVVKEDVPTVSSDTVFERALPILTQHKVVVLVDHQEKPIGILTVIDALAWMSQQRAE
ncbi:MAG: pyridoxal-phosphate dependent enzyme, partial [Anaerolineales bacterium]